MNAGQKFRLTDENILSINSPKNMVEGPYVVLHTNHKERWSVVVLEFDGHRTLGIRWFWGGGGTPFARQSTWFILPEELHRSTIDTCCLKLVKNKAIGDYLSGDIDAIELVSIWS